MSRAQQSLSPAAQQWVERILNQTDWLALPVADRLTRYRAQRTQLEAQAQKREAQTQARQVDTTAQEAAAWLARWTAGGRHGQ